MRFRLGGNGMARRCGCNARQIGIDLQQARKDRNGRGGTPLRLGKRRIVHDGPYDMTPLGIKRNWIRTWGIIGH